MNTRAMQVIAQAILFAGGLFLVDAGSLARAQTDPSALDVQVEAAKSVHGGRRAAAREVQAHLQDYLERVGLRVGPQVSGDSRVNVMLEVARTTRNPGEPGFHTARNTAYQRAYLAAIGKFLSQRSQEIGNQLGSVFASNSDNLRLLREICTPSQAEVVDAKLVQLAEAMVDQALRALDAAPSAPAQAPSYACPAEENLFRSRTSRRAAEALSGLRVVFSSEVDGQIGIVLVHSSRFERTARMLLHGQGTRRPAADPLSELREKLGGNLDPEVLRGTFGTRIVTTAGGEPVVVAFGQSGPDIGPADSDRTLDRKFETARRVAYNEAAAELARFARAMAVFSSESSQIDESGRYVDLESGAYEEPELVAQTLLERVETNSRLDVQGVAEVHAWEIEEDSNGQALVGVVLAWSPSLQSTYGRDAVDPALAPAGRQQDSSTPARHRARGAEMKEDW